MPFRLATVRDTQSAEHLKSRGLRTTDPSEALPIWRRARTLRPEDPTLIGHEALALLDLQRPREVVALLRDVLPEHPRHVHLINLMGVALHQLGHYDEAVRLFEHCLGLDDAHPTAQGNIDNARRARRKGRRPIAPDLKAVIDRTLEEAARRPRPTLAVCMIAKDEEEFIGDAIESVKGLADEIIVIDTGSSDRTVEIAEGAGADVGFFAWTGDFSEARNASLERATSDWILALDCDERVTSQSWTAIRAVMEEFGTESPRVVCPRIRNYTRDGRFMNDGFSGRLFPNRPDLRFEGRVHEEVGRGRTDVATDFRLDVVLDHYGADPEVMREKGKDERNVELLEARLAEKPDDLMTWFYLGSQHWLARRKQPALEAFERVIELFERNPAEYGLSVRHVPVPYSYVGATRALADLGRAREGVEVGHRGLARFPDNPDLWFHVGFVQIDLDDRDAARRCLERALSAELSGYSLIGMHDASIQQWRAEKGLGDLDFEAGDQRAAFERYRRIYEHIPDGTLDKVVTVARLVELSSGLGELDAAAEHTLDYVQRRPEEFNVAIQVATVLASNGELQKAYDLLTQVYETVERAQASVEVALTIGRIAEQASEDAEALRWYERVAELGCEDPRFWAELGKLLLRLGHEAPAAEALATARQLLGR